MSGRNRGRAVGWLVLATVCAVGASAGADESKPYIFRGIEPGATTADAVRASERWGAPKKEQPNGDGSLRWLYEPQGYKQAVVTIRGGRVQSVDVLLPDGIGIDDAAAALKLGIPVEGATPSAAAQLGAQMPKDWQPVAYSAGRALLFVDRKAGQARAVRSYAATVLDATAPAAAAVPAAASTTSAAVGAASARPAVGITGPTPAGREVMAGLAKVFPQHHISGHPVDEEIARRMKSLFIDRLDPNRLYLTREDVTQATRGPEAFAEQLRQGDLRAIYDLFRVFLDRVEERRALVEKLIASPHDFNADEQFDVTGLKDNWADNDLEIRDAWRKRVKYQMLIHLEAGATEEEARSRTLRDLRGGFDRWRKTTDDELLSIAAEEFAAAYDPRSGYYTARAWGESMNNLASQMVGVGASLQNNYGYTDVVKLIAGGPAATDGQLKEGDRIVAVGEGDGPMVEIVGMAMAEVVDKIRGAEGTKVRLRALPKGGFEAKVIELTRRKFTTQNIGSAVLTLDADGQAGKAKIGYVYLPVMYTDLAGQKAGKKDYRSTARDMTKMLADLKASNVAVAVVDLRDNPGGIITEAIEIAAHFVGGGSVLMVRDAQGRVNDYEPQTKPPVWDRPLVLITSKGSSGGAEILAAAVQDYRRGLIVGDSSTNANGAVATQTPLTELLYGEAAKNANEKAERLGVTRMTTQKFYRVTGGGIQARGVVPDIVLPSLSEGAGATQFDLPYVLSLDSVKGVEFTPAKAALDEAYMKLLAASSQERRDKSAYFKKLTALVGQLAERKKKYIVPLNKEKFLAERKENASFDADTATVPGVPDVKLTPYLQEVFAISLEYAARQSMVRADAALKERRFADSLAEQRRAVEISPTMKSARYRLAWSLATISDKKFRNGKQAVEHAQRLCEQDGRNNWTYVLALAVAQAEAGNFEQAESELKAALEKAPEAGKKQYEPLKQRFRNRQSYPAQ